MRVFVSFEGKKSRHLENLSHCLYVDTKKMFTVFDFLLHLKRKYALKEHYYLSLSLDQYFIADNENIKVLHDSDKLTVRISKMNATPKCFRTDDNLNSADMETADSCVSLIVPPVDATLRQQETDKHGDDQARSQNFAETRKDHKLSSGKDKTSLNKVPKKASETQPSKMSVDLFLPRKFQLKPVTPRAKINLGSLAVSSSSLNSRKDRLQKSAGYIDKKSRPNHAIDVDADCFPDCGQTRSPYSRKQRFVKAKEPDFPATDVTGFKTNLSPTSLKTREIKKGHIKFDSDDNENEEVLATSPIIDYSPIVKPIYKEPPPLENSQLLESTGSAQEKTAPKLSKSSTAEANVRRGAMVDKILDAYNKKMDSILEGLGTQGSGSESDNEADDESTASEDKAMQKTNTVPKSAQKVLPEKIGTEDTVKSQKADNEVVEKSRPDEQNCEPASGLETNLQSNKQSNDPGNLLSSRIKPTPGLNIFSVVSQLNRELKESKNSEELEAISQSGSLDTGEPENSTETGTSKQKDTSVKASKQNDRNGQEGQECAEIGEPQESLEDLLRRSREHIAKNREQNEIAGNSSVDKSCSSVNPERRNKRKADANDADSIVEKVPKTNGLANADIPANGTERQRFDISDDENEESAEDAEVANSSFSNGKADSTDNKSVREVKFSVASSSSKGSLNISKGATNPPAKTFDIPSSSSGVLAPIRPGSCTFIPVQNGNPKIGTQKAGSGPASVKSAFKSSLNSKESSSSSGETSEDEAAIKACVKRTSVPKTAPAFGAVWSPKVLTTSAFNVTQNVISISSKDVISNYPKAKPTQSWCEKEPQKNTSQIFQSASCSSKNVSTSNASETQQTDKPPSKTDLKDLKNELFQPGNTLSFNVLDLDENFRPDIVSKSGTVISADHENKTVKIKFQRNEKADDVQLSRRASILHEGLAISSAENGSEETVIDPNDVFEEREFKMDDLFEVKVVEIFGKTC